MINDESFLSQSITLNLFFLTTFRAFCVNIGFSLLEKDKDIADIARSYIRKCDFLISKVIDYANGNVPEEVLENNILFTQYTLDCEQITEKLFDLNLYTDNTIRMQNIKPGIPTNPTNEELDVLMDVNEKALMLSKEFTFYLKDLYMKQINNEIFSYTYPFLTKKMFESMDFYTELLIRVINRNDIDPSFTSIYEQRATNLMISYAKFIRDFLDPARRDLFIRAQSFVVEFELLEKTYLKTALSPENQKEYVSKLLNLITRFGEYVSDVIDAVLKKEAYLTVAPILIDDYYRAINYYKYVIGTFAVEL